VKRFWKQVSVTKEGEGWGIRLDGRPVHTPAGAPLIVPNEVLARAIADEWEQIGEKIDPRATPLTGLANAAIDKVAPGKDAFAQGLGRYAEADLACYRADSPKGLAERQAQSWDALLNWARRRFDVDFVTTTGLAHVEQPSATVERLAHEVVALGPFELAGLSPLVTIGGSLIAALAVLEKALTPDIAWDAVSLDDRWQLESWGSDAEAEAALENRRKDVFAAARFLELLEA